MNRLFSFHTSKDDDLTAPLEVVTFEGYQEIGTLYRFEIALLSKDQAIDCDSMLDAEVTLQLHHKDSTADKDKDTYIHGVLEYFEAHQKVDGYVYYKAALVPKLWWLTLAQHQQLFLQKSVHEIIETVLKDAKFTSAEDYEFSLKESHNDTSRDYVCQYAESRFDFIERWMHRNGIYFYFKSDKEASKLFITDSNSTQEKIPEMAEIYYDPASGLHSSDSQTIASIVNRSNHKLQSVHVRDYNYEKPSKLVDKVSDADKDNTAPGYRQSYLYGHNLKSDDEAIDISNVQLQKSVALKKQLIGSSNIRALTPGYLFTLKDYFSAALNDKEYLMVRVESQGSQTSIFSTKVQKDLGLEKNTFEYKNTFMMIPASTQYRMQESAPWPHISGMISAKVDGEGDAANVKVDDQGRYKIVLPFDLAHDFESTNSGKASAYIRMAQPSAGVTQGMHFPLHIGTEVLISFTQGDPDQPVITGAIPNPDTPSPVTSDNATQSIVQSEKGHQIIMDDDTDNPYVKMVTADGKHSIVLGKNGNNPAEEAKEALEKANENKKEIETNEQEIEDIKNEITAYYKTEGSSFTLVKGHEDKVVLYGKEEANLADEVSLTAGASVEIAGGEILKLEAGAIQEFVFDIKKRSKYVTPEATHISKLKNYIGQRQEETFDQKIQAIVKATRWADVVNDQVEERVEEGDRATTTLKDKIDTVQRAIITMERVTNLIEGITNEVEEMTISANTVNMDISTLFMVSVLAAGMEIGTNRAGMWAEESIFQLNVTGATLIAPEFRSNVEIALLQ